jgi:hypothetical protein
MAAVADGEGGRVSACGPVSRRVRAAGRGEAARVRKRTRRTGPDPRAAVTGGRAAAAPLTSSSHKQRHRLHFLPRFRRHHERQGRGAYPTGRARPRGGEQLAQMIDWARLTAAAGALVPGHRRRRPAAGAPRMPGTG